MDQTGSSKVEILSCDVTTTTAPLEILSHAQNRLAGVDILVNNAGVSGQKLPMEDVDEEAFDRMFDIQVRGSFFATQAVLPGMKQRKSGRIIMISSIYAMGGSSFASHYAAAKAALSGFTKAWAREFAPYRIQVNAVAPGFVLTGMTRGSNTPEMVKERGEGMPLGRLTEPEDISYAVAWLASSETEMITGQVISPNSGEVIVGY